ncbi:probable cytochrome P450 9f2 isoform X2 [Plodia interpunctella]|uniref:probable cytochrome P450 9f2 isoform X2 n=1 Tax=Plodia interpunctella TaxID=58824 RepID=UPI002367803D|nr:probable cytochrome P450 9f2 isoform X2 [Plodia interpunctella]
MIVEIIIFIITFIIAYFCYKHKCLHWMYDKKGIKYVPGIPIFGNTYNTVFVKEHFFHDIDVTYRAFPDEKYVGFIEGTDPVILIRDPEIIRNTTVKDFDHFVDHKAFFSEDSEPLFGGSLIQMKGEKWRDMRTTLSPAFTASKMRLMINFMFETSNNVIDELKDRVSKQEDIHVDDLIRRYTNDVIASAGFGLQVNSVKEKDNEFFLMGRDLFVFSFYQRVLFFLYTLIPWIFKVLDIKLFPEKTMNFFKNIVRSTIEHRTTHNVYRPDMIQLLMEASNDELKTKDTDGNGSVGFATTEEAFKPKGNARKWTEEELIGQVFIFFIAGFESSAGALTTTIHELALNPEVEEKLYQECKQFRDSGNSLTYDNVAQLKYLDCVINENMRKWAAAIIMDRTCTKAYELPPPREGAKPVKLKPGDVIYNMVNSIHMDEKYFPNPEVFDPERFSDENKHKIKPFTFMPFGMGPRNCIASRFALLELKVLLYNLVVNFKIKKSKKTLDPIVLNPADFNIKVLGGSYVKMEPRE